SYIRTYHPPSHGCGTSPRILFTSSAVIRSSHLSKLPTQPNELNPRDCFMLESIHTIQLYCEPAQTMLSRLETYFGFASHQTTWRTEILAGLTTFVTMAYII